MTWKIVILSLGLAGCAGLHFAGDDELASTECESRLGLAFGTDAYASCYERVRSRLRAQEDALFDRNLRALQ